MIDLARIEAVYPLLHELLTGMILVEPDGLISYANPAAQVMLGRRLRRRDARAMLGRQAYHYLCEQVLVSGARVVRWEELTLTLPGGQAEAMARSFGVRYPDDRQGVLVALFDISGEVGLERERRKLLERQRTFDHRLRREIAEQLRVHEDDLTQFAEILQIAPAIFGPFAEQCDRCFSLLTQLSHAIDEPVSTDGAVGPKAGAWRELLERTLRAMHTLKGNARSLGLNFIGGRAHALEELLQAVDAPEAAAEQHEGLLELIEALERAVERAREIRRTLDAANLGDSDDVELEHVTAVSDAVASLKQALAQLEPQHPARAALAGAIGRLEPHGCVPLEWLFRYAAATVASAARSAELAAPTMRTRGAEIEVSPATLRALWTAVPHLLRNAVAHGLEPADERTREGKPASGTLELTAELGGDRQLRLQVADDGRGLDADALRARGERWGADRNADISELLFLTGVSTASTTTLERGRGLGAPAAREAIREAGGTIRLLPDHSPGVAFEILLPA